LKVESTFELICLIYTLIMLNNVTSNQSKSPPISISYSSAGLGSYLGLAFSTGFSAGLAVYLEGFSAGAGAELPPTTDPKNSVTDLLESALATALTRV
jgi:hypothetical protein